MDHQKKRQTAGKAATTMSQAKAEVRAPAEAQKRAKAPAEAQTQAEAEAATDARTRSRQPADVRETSSYSAENLPARYLLFAFGVVVNSFGIALITKGALGTSPISSLPYVLCLRYTAFSFGATTFVVNLAFIAVQAALLRRDFQPVQLLQVPATVVFSWFIDLSTSLLGLFEADALPVQLACVVLGCAVLAFGICVEIAPNVLFLPGEGAVRAIAALSGARFGTVKICFDLGLVAVALALSFVFFGGIRGMGLGTVVSAVAVGKIVNLFNTRLPFLESIRLLAR